MKKRVRMAILARSYNLAFHHEVDDAVTQVPEVADSVFPVHLCAVEDVAEGAAIGIEKELSGEQHAFIVTCADGQIHAYHNVCPHAGRRLDWAPGRFLLKDRVLVCAAHGASFRIESGLCTGGPCQGDHLARVGIEIENDEVLLTGL
jgi:nitrite reductase/ring-hydroxylating ferredoxin subunit